MAKILAVTHNDRFHADDVFAAATLQLVYGKEISFKRTRDNDEIEKADIVFDVGHIYSPEKNRFDHHQTEGAGERENGINYASFGLVWKKFGTELCGSKEVSDKVDKNLVQIIDSGDTGVSICEPLIKDVEPISFDRMFMLFGSTWKEEENYDEAFVEVVQIARRFLEREIIVAKHKFEAVPVVKEVYKNTKNKKLLILDEYLPFGDVVRNEEEILFVVSPNKNNSQWRVNAVAIKEFVFRKTFPESWGGLRGEDLEQVTGVKGSIFCHRDRFLTAADSKEAAIKLAELALEN